MRSAHFLRPSRLAHPAWLPLALAVACTLLAMTTGCGKQQFQPVAATQGSTGPGYFTVPPKVDILVAQDDTGSMWEAEGIRAQFVSFLDKIKDRGWDYHFAVTPLTTRRAITQVAASPYDANWGSAWTAPFPGMARPEPGTQGSVVPYYFRKPENFTQFLSNDELAAGGNGFEPGLETIVDALHHRSSGTGFMRDDALLVVLVVGNGNDTSGMGFKNRGPGDPVQVPDPAQTRQDCVSSAGGGNQACTFEFYRDEIRRARTQPALVQFHAAVADNYYGYPSCQGGNASAGSRYMRMAGEVGGSTYNICAKPLSGILDTFAQNLEFQKVSYRTRYLFIGSEPEESSLRVTRYVNGDANQAQVIPQDATNGWTYEGYKENVYAIDYPTEMNLTSGYTIELHGSARLSGADRVEVGFQAKGLKPSN